MKSIEIYTDGSCLGNPGPGGWAALMVYGYHEKMVSGGEKHTTNNRMELSAILGGLKALKEKCYVSIITDSKYCQTVICGGSDSPTKSFSKKTRCNVELICEVKKEALKHDVVFKWIKGHDGHIENELVDIKAKEVAHSIKNGG